MTLTLPSSHLADADQSYYFYETNVFQLTVSLSTPVIPRTENVAITLESSSSSVTLSTTTLRFAPSELTKTVAVFCGSTSLPIGASISARVTNLGEIFIPHGTASFTMAPQIPVVLAIDIADLVLAVNRSQPFPVLLETSETAALGAVTVTLVHTNAAFESTSVTFLPLSTDVSGSIAATATAVFEQGTMFVVLSGPGAPAYVAATPSFSVRSFQDKFVVVTTTSEFVRVGETITYKFALSPIPTFADTIVDIAFLPNPFVQWISNGTKLNLQSPTSYGAAVGLSVGNYNIADLIAISSTPRVEYNSNIQAPAAATNFSVLVGTPAPFYTPIKAFMQDITSSISNLVAVLTTKVNERCLSSCTSSATVAGCGNTFPESKGFTCRDDWGHLSTCPSSPLIRSNQTTSVLFAPNTSPDDAAVSTFVCSTQNLHQTFAAQLNTTPYIAWQYFASYTGATRMFPAAPAPRSLCGSFDVRQTAWYAAATTGPKDLVLVIDVSGSMAIFDPVQGKTRMQLMQRSVNRILDSLTDNDFVNIVAFSTLANVLGPKNGLLRATSANVGTLKAAVANLNPQGNTFFGKAFEVAFSLYNASTSSGCNNKFMIFATDGVSGDNADDVYNTVEAHQSITNPIPMLTFSYTDDADTTIPRFLACQYNGIWSKINNGADPAAEMAAYEQFISAGIATESARWTAPHADPFGLGQVVTV